MVYVEVLPPASFPVGGVNRFVAPGYQAAVGQAGEIRTPATPTSPTSPATERSHGFQRSHMSHRPGWIERSVSLRRYADTPIRRHVSALPTSERPCPTSEPTTYRNPSFSHPYGVWNGFANVGMTDALLNIATGQSSIERLELAGCEV